MSTSSISRRQISYKQTQFVNEKKIDEVKYYDSRKNALSVLEKLGINFRNIELPPDENDIVVHKSFTHSALSLVPFTAAYYESLAAEQNLDDYKQIEADKLNAAKDYQLTKLGESENVLQKLLTETTNDFFYFNKLKTKLEREGRKFNFKKIEASDYDNSAYFPSETSSSSSTSSSSFLSSNTKKIFNYLKLPTTMTSSSSSLIPIKSASEAAASSSSSTNRQNEQSLPSRPLSSSSIPINNKNKLRQARAKNFLILNNRLMSSQQIMESEAYSLNRDSPCVWKGKSKTGKYLQCGNTRMSHPYKTIRNEDGDMVPLMLIYCSYHYPTCLSTFHRVDEKITIKIPNSHALCTECYLTLGEGPPRKLQLINSPGVVEAEDMMAMRQRKEELIRKQLALENDTKTPRSVRRQSIKLTARSGSGSESNSTYGGQQYSSTNATAQLKMDSSDPSSNTNHKMQVANDQKHSNAFHFNESQLISSYHSPSSSSSHHQQQQHEWNSPKINMNLQRKSMLSTKTKLTSTSICNWTSTTAASSSSDLPKHLKFPVELLSEDGYYKCQNVIIRSETTGEYLPTCGLHCLICIKDHYNNQSTAHSIDNLINDTITMPNVYALCNTHYMSQFGMKPESVSHPWPGVVYCPFVSTTRQNSGSIRMSRSSVIARTKSTMGSRLSISSHHSHQSEQSDSRVTQHRRRASKRSSLSVHSTTVARDTDDHHQYDDHNNNSNNDGNEEDYDDGHNNHDGDYDNYNDEDNDDDEDEITYGTHGHGTHGLHINTYEGSGGSGEQDVSWAMPQSHPPRHMMLRPFTTAATNTTTNVTTATATSTVRTATKTTAATVTAVTGTAASSTWRRLLCLSQPPEEINYDANATAIQAWYRGITARELIYQDILSKQRLRRHYAAIQIQTAVRQFLYYNRFQPFKEMIIRSTIKYQALYRAYKIRCWYPSYRAAIIITKFFRHIRAYRFQNITIMNAALELFFNRRDEYAIKIQSLFRGYRIRLWIFEDDLRWFIINRKVKIIQKLFKINVRNKKLLKLKKQNEAEIEAKVHFIISKRIVKLIDKTYGNWKVQQNILMRQYMATRLLQRVLRGWLGRLGVKRLKLIKMQLHFLLFGTMDYRNNKHTVSLIYANNDDHSSSRNHTSATATAAGAVINGNTTTTAIGSGRDGNMNDTTHTSTTTTTTNYKYLDNGQRKHKQQQQQTLSKSMAMEVDKTIHINYLDLNLQKDIVYELSAFPSMSSMSVISDHSYMQPPSAVARSLVNFNDNQPVQGQVQGKGKGKLLSVAADGRIIHKHTVNTTFDDNQGSGQGRGFLFKVDTSHNNNNMLIPEDHRQEHSEYEVSQQFHETGMYNNNNSNSNSGNIKTSSQDNRVQSVVPFTDPDRNAITVLPTMSRHGKSLLTGPDCGPDEDILNNSMAALSVHTSTSLHTFLSAAPSTATTSIRQFLPMKVEEQHFHEIKIDIFKKAIHDYFNDLKLILNNKEYDYLVERFINPATGNMNINNLDDYFSLHKYPCRKHGFTICGKCSYYGQCMVDGCSCLLYKTSKMNDTSKTGLCECNHVRGSHRLTPESLRPLNNHRIKLDTIIHSTRDLDFKLPDPKKIKGIQAKTILHDAEISKRKKSIADHIYTNINPSSSTMNSNTVKSKSKEFNRATAAASASSKSTSFVPHPLSTSHMPSNNETNKTKNKYNNNNNNNSDNQSSSSSAAAAASPLLLLDESEIYIQIQNRINQAKTEATQNQLQLEKTHQNLMSITTTLPSSLSVSASISQNIQQSTLHPDMYNSSYNAAIDPNFWKTISKNPVKSLRDYTETFNQNMPMTYIKNNKIVYTYEGTKLYTHILNMLIRLYEEKGEEYIDHNSYVFLDLLVNHVTLFERHWRKMVFDIREGTLSSGTEADDEQDGQQQLQLQQQQHRQKQKQKQNMITSGVIGRKSSGKNLATSAATATATVSNALTLINSSPNPHVARNRSDVLVLNSDDVSCSDLLSVSSHQSNSDTSLGFSAITTAADCSSSGGSSTAGATAATMTRNRKKVVRLPRPELSQKLDSVFRHLGFHKKAVGGKDLDLHSFGQLKDWHGYPHDPI